MNEAFVLHDLYLCQAPMFEAQPGFALLIEQGRIARIAPEETLLALGTRQVNCGGAYALPGLIDCHSHLSLDCKLPDYLQIMNSEAARLAIIAYKTLERDLKSGVTLSRCMGDRFYIDVLCRGMVEEGYINGPRLKVSGIGMRGSHGHGFVGMPFDGEDALRNAVRENLKRGVDWIKFYATGTVADGQRIQSMYSTREIACIMEEAHRAGRPVTSHCIGGPAMLDSIALGIDCIEHAYFAGEQEIEAVYKAGIPICLTPGEFFTDKSTVPAASLSLFQKNRPRVRKSMEAILAANIPFVLGTDGQHGQLWQEASYAVQFGAQPAAVLNALTANAAKLLGMQHECGSLAQGYYADILLVGDNPLANIESLRDVRAVYKKGIAI